MKRKLVPTMAIFAAGAAFGVGFVLSCSDTSPRRIDATTCDCAASEPPLAGRFVTTSYPTTIAAGSVGVTSISCPTESQAIAITGSCIGANPNQISPNLVLIQSGFSEDPPALPTGWGCAFKNNGATSITVKTTVLCLKPAS